MKILKIVGIIVLVVVLLALVGGFIFLKTLDLNSYVPAIAEQVKKAVGRDLKIGRADLRVSLFRGISLEVSGVSLSDDRRFSDQSFLSVDKVFCGLSLKPLILERKIQIAEVTIVAPKVVIIRNKEGLINAAMMSPAAPSGTTPAQQDNSAKAAALPALLVDRVKVTNATVTYIDETFSPKLALTADRIDFSINGFSLTDDFSFELKAALFSQDPDIDLNGKARLGLNTASVWVKEMECNVDFSKMTTEKLNSMLPMAAPAGLKDPLQGQLTISVPELRAGASGLQSLKMEGALTGGHVETSLIPFPLQDIALTFNGDAKDLVIKSCDLSLAEGKVKVSGAVQGYMSSPVIELTGTVSDLALEKVTEAYKLPVKIVGKANADAKISLAGKTPQEMTSSLKADISVSLKDGTLEGINLVQLGLGNIPMLPTLWEMVQPSLPAETRSDLKKGVTVIESSDILVHMTGMTANVERAEIVTRDIVASAKGTAKVPETVDFKADIYFQKAISAALVQKVNDLAGIQDDQGKLYIPLQITGPMLKPKVIPDTDYLSKKLLLNRGREELQKVLEKNPQAQGVLNAIFGGAKTDSTSQTETSQSNAQQGNGEGKDAESGAAQAVNAVFDSLFHKK